MSLIWINTLLALLGTVGGMFLAMGSVISIANMQVSWAGSLLIAAFGVPILFAGSGVAGWIVHEFYADQYLSVLTWLPWMYLLVFVGVMLLTFMRKP